MLTIALFLGTKTEYYMTRCTSNHYLSTFIILGWPKRSLT